MKKNSSRKMQNEASIILEEVDDEIIINSQMKSMPVDLDDPDFEEYQQLKSTTDKSTDKSVEEDSSCETEQDDENSKQNSIGHESSRSSHGGNQSQARPETNFFYTSDKFINAFEDDEITHSIQEKYPMFKSIDVDDTMMRKTIIDMLNDSKFMVKLLKYYNMTIFDFIKFLFRQEPSLFKGQFVKRIQKSLKYKKYVSQDKKQAFRYSPKRKAKIRRKRG